MSKHKPGKPDPSQRNAFTKPEFRQLHPLSMRTVERIVRRAAVSAGIIKEVCCRTLRRSYAVQCLRDGMDVASLRQNLGHKYKVMESHWPKSGFHCPTCGTAVIEKGLIEPRRA